MWRWFAIAAIRHPLAVLLVVAWGLAVADGACAAPDVCETGSSLQACE